jgi:hypothetical protein
MLVSLSAIRTDGDTQSRAAISSDTVAEYADAMRDGATFPPITLFHDGSNYWLADGFHRVVASRRFGASEIAADVHIGTREDALWFAIGANKANGIRPNRGDVKHAVELALRTWPGRSQVEIAAQVGCAQQYVSRLKAEFTTCGELTEQPATVTGRDGKTYPTTKTKATRVKAEKQAVCAGDDEGRDEQAPPSKEAKKQRRDDQECRERALRSSQSAIGKLQEIAPDNPHRDEALNDVVRWIKFNR